MWRAFWKSGRSQCSRTRAAFSGYMDERLNPEEAARVEEHLDTCRGCREELESLRATVALLHSLPEETPSRRFAVVPARPLPGRRALPGLRYATAGAVLLLVMAFAADWTGLFPGGIVSSPRFDSSALNWGSDRASEEDESYWVVAGVVNSLSDNSQMSVDLVVPNHTDNVYVAVDSVEANGVVYGAMKSVPDEVPQLVLTKDGSVAATRVEVRAYTVVSASDAEQSHFATNDTESTKPAFHAIIEGQDRAYLNMVQAASDNNVLYSFDLGNSRREVIAAQDNDWLRPLEYGLLGLVAVLGGATAILWLRQKRERAAEVSKSKE